MKGKMPNFEAIIESEPRISNEYPTNPSRLRRIWPPSNDASSSDVVTLSEVINPVALSNLTPVVTVGLIVVLKLISYVVPFLKKEAETAFT